MNEARQCTSSDTRRLFHVDSQCFERHLEPFPRDRLAGEVGCLGVEAQVEDIHRLFVVGPASGGAAVGDGRGLALKLLGHRQERQDSFAVRGVLDADRRASFPVVEPDQVVAADQNDGREEVSSQIKRARSYTGAMIQTSWGNVRSRNCPQTQIASS